MRVSTSTNLKRAAVALLLTLPLGCSSRSDNPSSGGSTGSGGAVGSGGIGSQGGGFPIGGYTAAGGIGSQGGGFPTGGYSSTGGYTATGGTLGAGGSTGFACGDLTDCPNPDPVNCACLGCGSTCVDANGESLSDCVCAVCKTDAYCSDPTSCNDDGYCDPFAESCACADCAKRPGC